jgi:hypothetical protein
MANLIYLNIRSLVFIFSLIAVFFLSDACRPQTCPQASSYQQSKKDAARGRRHKPQSGLFPKNGRVR